MLPHTMFPDPKACHKTFPQKTFLLQNEFWHKMFPQKTAIAQNDFCHRMFPQKRFFRKMTSATKCFPKKRLLRKMTPDIINISCHKNSSNVFSPVRNVLCYNIFTMIHNVTNVSC